MGEWVTPDPKVPLRHVLESPAFGVRNPYPLAAMLVETGFVVTTDYYVPDVDELFAMYRQLAEVDYYGRGRSRQSWIRWVMCGETHLALHRKYGQTRAVHAPHLSAFMASGDLDDFATVSHEMHMVITNRAAASIPAALDAGRLFDMPIRRDPAARRPLFEFVDDAKGVT